MLSKIPINLDGIRRENLDKEILRAAIIAELDAINLYEQMSGTTQNDNIRKLLLDVDHLFLQHMVDLPKQ